MRINNSTTTAIVLLLGWTLLMGILVFKNLSDNKRHTMQLAAQTARTIFNHIVQARAWNSSHGGVYLLETERTQPNPYLKPEDRELILPDGRRLTRINPAFMTRLISEMAEKASDVKFHITSLKPIRPENGPDKWEEKALLAFEKGEAERFQLFPDQKQPIYRFMSPLTVTETCLPCHTEQGYEVGDIRGGISVSMPADEYISTTMSKTVNIWMTYSGIWFVGLLGMVAYFFQNRKTERKITSQLMFQNTLLDCMPTPVFYKDEKGRYIGCNKTFESFLGIDKKDIIGKTVYQISPSEAAKKYHEQDTTLINNGGSQVYEHYVETKDKGRREVIFSKAVFQDSTGRSAGIVGVITDITDRRRLEQNLKRTANEFETIFDNTSMAIVYLKGDRTIHRINKQFSRLFGYDQDEIEGKSVEIIHLSHELFLEFGEKCYPLLKEETVVQVEYQLKTKAGKMIWGNLFGKAVNPPHLEDGIIWIFEDITERKELEKLKADVDLIMIHDLRSPIAGIISAAKLLLMEETTKEEQRTLITELERSAYRLLSRINLSLDLYRMEMGNYEYKPKQLDLINILNQVKQNLTELISSKDMRIVTLFDGRTAKGDSTFMVAADELLIPTMLTNIIQNAVEASPMGGIVTVDMTKEAEFNSITVNNPGVVPEPMRDNFFDKYATHGKPKGTGLGTYSAKLMTETMGGSISMVTDEKEGTTISVTLPA